jgi:hypothetical protein
MKTVSGNNHLLRRNGVYYYRRRVPPQLIKPIGSKVIQVLARHDELQRGEEAPHSQGP